MTPNFSRLSFLALLGLAAVLVAYRAAFSLARRLALSPADWPFPPSAP
jgi:hypothetical protein